MSRHEGVSCDACMKGNFRGKRYKCLICYDYDLCANCYDTGTTTSRHTADHPVQCILTRTDIDVYFRGETLTADQPQSFTCPFCGRMGFTEVTLQDHVTADHADATAEVVCPICAALPGGDPNHVTEDFSAHLTLEHRGPRDFDEPLGGMRRRIPHPGRGGGGAGSGGIRTRRNNMHLQAASGSPLAGLAPASRDTMDPIAELLSQLSNVRSRASAAQSVSSQLQQLEMQLQSTRQQLERLPGRRGEGGKALTTATTTSSMVPSSGGATDLTAPSQRAAANSAARGSSHSATGGASQFLLARCRETDSTESEKQSRETASADRSAFVQELVLATLSQSLRLDSNTTPSTTTQEHIAVIAPEDEDSSVESSSAPQLTSSSRPASKHTVQNSGHERSPPTVQH